jgi:hypothetical protein
MQTFLPYADFHETARVLDDKRLGNQAYNECKVLITGGWPNHPASKMWSGYRCALAYYALALLEELSKRGRHYEKWINFYNDIADGCCNEGDMPPWLGREDIHSSHRANLLRKNPEWYGQFGWTEEPVEGYVWPS